MITAKCPHCQTGIRGEDRFAGRVVNCPKCKKQLQMPDAPQPNLGADPDVQVPVSQPIKPQVATPPSIVSGAVKKLTEHPQLADQATFTVPEFAPEDASSVTDKKTNNGKAELKASTLRPCPDCGKMVSRRASQCPSCACPLDPINVFAPTMQSRGQPTSAWKRLPFLVKVGLAFGLSSAVMIVASFMVDSKYKRELRLEREVDSRMGFKGDEEMKELARKYVQGYIDRLLGGDRSGCWMARRNCSRTVAAAMPKSRTPWSRNCTSRSVGFKWSWAG